jgi:hypothetical protein
MNRVERVRRYRQQVLARLLNDELADVESISFVELLEMMNVELAAIRSRMNLPLDLEFGGGVGGFSQFAVRACGFAGVFTPGGKGVSFAKQKREAFLRRHLSWEDPDLFDTQTPCPAQPEPAAEEPTGETVVNDTAQTLGSLEFTEQARVNPADAFRNVGEAYDMMWDMAGLTEAEVMCALDGALSDLRSGQDRHARLRVLSCALVLNGKAA